MALRATGSGQESGKSKWETASESVLFPFQSGAFTDEGKSFYDKIITSVSEQQIEGTESSPTDVPSQKESGKPDSREQQEGRPTGERGTGGQAPAAS